MEKSIRMVSSMAQKKQMNGYRSISPAALRALCETADVGVENLKNGFRYYNIYSLVLYVLRLDNN